MIAAKVHVRDQRDAELQQPGANVKDMRDEIHTLLMKA